MKAHWAYTLRRLIEFGPMPSDHAFGTQRGDLLVGIATQSVSIVVQTGPPIGAQKGPPLRDG
ncbi:hypothetical protein, partial [Sphingobium sp.]|uniref:hypothetical protein n=1 Tax=Sphingobium sp. TaxID=1912891 RepID=UPI002E22CBC4